MVFGHRVLIVEIVRLSLSTNHLPGGACHGNESCYLYGHMAFGPAVSELQMVSGGASSISESKPSLQGLNKIVEATFAYFHLLCIHNLSLNL
jgi:hypothetical protein